MEKRNKTILIALTTIMLIFSLVLPIFTVQANGVDANNLHHQEAYADVVVEYEREVPSESELDPTYKNIRTSKFTPTRAMTIPTEDIKEIVQDPHVAHLKYNQEATPSQNPAPAAEPATASWNTGIVQANYAHGEGITGAGVDVAVIDTGFYTDHPNLSFAGGVSIFEDDPWTNDHTGHGTHVSGIIGGGLDTTYPGVAPGANIYGIKVYHRDNFNEYGAPTTDTFNITEGIYEAMNIGADIIVISSGFTGPNVDMHRAIQAATDQGILIAAASGNGKDSVDYPASYPEVLSITSVGQNLQAAGDIISGSENDLTAPGVGVTSLSSPGSSYGYPFATLSGSSQAAPHAAGVAALLMEAHGLTASGARTMLLENARDLGDPALFGNGLVQYLTPSQRQAIQDAGSEEKDNKTETDSVEDNPETTSDDTDQTSPPNAEDTAGGNEETNTYEQNNANLTEESETEQSSSESEEEAEDHTKEPSSDTATQEPEENHSTSEGVSENDSEPKDEENSEDPEQETVKTKETKETQSIIWINPDADGTTSTISGNLLGSLGQNGTLAISIEPNLSEITEFHLEADQVEEIIDKNISILIAENDMEWVIPASNLSQGDATFQFTIQNKENYTSANEALSSVYNFNIVQNGETVTDFNEPMDFRFIPDEELDPDEHSIYVWNNTEEWLASQTGFRDPAAQTSVNHTGTFATFSNEVFAQTDQEESISQAEDQQDESEASQESVSVSLQDQSQFSMYTLISGIIIFIFIVVVILTIVRKNRNN